MTLNLPLKDQQLKLENTMDLDVQLQQKQSQETIGQKYTNVYKIYDLERNTLGDLCEYFVAIEAIKRGAKVYRNVVKTGYADLILEINNKFIPVDVKSKTWNYQTAKWQSETKNAACQVISVEIDDVNGWKVTWPRQHVGGHPKDRPFQCPEGLEHFWE